MEFYLVWFSSILGAGLFYAAGWLTRRRRQQEPIQSAEYTDPRAFEQTQVAMQELRFLHQQQLATTQEAQAEAQARILALEATASDREQTIANALAEREGAMKAASTARASLKQESQRSQKAKADLPRLLEGERSRALLNSEADLSKMRAANSQLQSTNAQADGNLAELNKQLAELNKQLAEQEKQLAELNKQLYEQHSNREHLERKLNVVSQDRDSLASSHAHLATMQSQFESASKEVADGKQIVRTLYSELELLRGKVQAGESRQRELVILRTKVHDNSYLEHEIEELKKQVLSLKAQELALVKPLPVTLAEATANGSDHDTIRCRLLAVVNGIASKARSNAVVLADNMGLPVVTAGEHGAELAAYASILAQVAGKAGQFIPVAEPDHMELVDKNGTTITVWPFDVGSETLSLITLSNVQSGVVTQTGPAVRGAVEDVTQILAQLH